MTPKELAAAIARAALRRRAENVVILDMRSLIPLCDYFLICSGRSAIHVQAIAEEIVQRLEEQGVEVGHVEGLPEARWVLLDYLDVVAHVFTPEARDYYALEQLWADAPAEKIEEETVQTAPTGDE
ncbi:MAG: ribosome silencing factor [Armatimonadetes bacterium]|nr:ribosome silencing factor [Armatimonadota bacterium]